MRKAKQNNLLRISGLILIFLMTAVSFSTVLWGNTFSELAKRTDVSRLEFAMFTINQKLFEEFRDDYFFNSFNDVYDTDVKVETKFFTRMSGEDLYILAQINEWINCDRANSTFENNDLKDIVSSKMDTLAEKIMFFLGHFGEYDRKSIHGNNIVHHRVAELFGYSDYSKINLEYQELGEAISENFKVMIAAKYCEKDNIQPILLRYVYPLNADYNRRPNREEGEKKFPERTLLEW